ncbi:ferritin [Parenemella sanctibonifatiensis]|uniref:Ferritin n=1 Tax=Parenemella sanctibonifatiensis TaxID=2016505 RepID=A0A255EHT4_9ACTN|nr:ferritin [Parenemella sanctibonifatiensis]OYN86478.1 ferritin [Parenemella sanctibonifatiensis]OYN91084.1 ferritin [Parenemella sanctibonifatiensis]
MKLSSDLVAAFNTQITLEFEASIVYRQLSIAADSQDLPGLASWLRLQADEELIHAHKFIDHVVDRGDAPAIGAISAPVDTSSMSIQDIFEAALAHEEKVSEAIRTLYRACDAAGDLDSRPLLHWFLEEQIEEEATVGEIVGRIKLIGDDGPGLLRLDAELGQRNEA